MQREIDNVLKFRNLSKTRWVYSSESIEAVWRIYEEIPKAIDEIVTAAGVEPKVKARGNGIKTKLLSFDFLFGLMFMRLIMKKTNFSRSNYRKKSSIFWTHCC